MSNYNTKSGSVKRLLKEAREMEAEACPSFAAEPLENDLFEWHFTIRIPHAEYQGGIYHGRLLAYPLAPPDVMLLTPNGRFELNKKICLSMTGYHNETWQPAWGIRTALLALIAFFESDGKGAIGSLDLSSDERLRLARLSVDWHCGTCGKSNKELVPPIEEPQAEPSGSESGSMKEVEPPVKEEEVASPTPTPTPTVQAREAPPAAPSLPTPAQAPSAPSVSARIRPDAPLAAVPVKAPAWIDRLIGLLVVLLAVLVIRKSSSFDLGSQAESLAKA